MMTEDKAKAAGGRGGSATGNMGNGGRLCEERGAAGYLAGETERTGGSFDRLRRCTGGTAAGKPSLLGRYFQQGWLSKKYYVADGYRQLYSAEDRLLAGTMLYADFLKWGKGQLRVHDYAMPKVDGGSGWDDWLTGIGAENFRRALKKVSAPFVPVLYKIVLEEKEIRAPKGASTRERLYFNDEIKSLLCRALDELVPYYRRRV